MIKNIIFDLGRVLISFYPEEYCKKNYSSQKANIILNDIFKDKIWIDLDKGIVDDAEAIEYIYKKGNLKKSEIEDLFEKRSIFMKSIDINTNLIKLLKCKGYSLYVISNFHKVPFEKIKAKYSFFEHFNGIVISAYINIIKPNPEIFNYTMDKYNLHSNETLFIDDCKENIESAKRLGIHTIHLANPKNLASELKKLNIL